MFIASPLLNIPALQRSAMCLVCFTLHSAPYGASISVGQGYKHLAPLEQGPAQLNIRHYHSQS